MVEHIKVCFTLLNIVKKDLALCLNSFASFSAFIWNAVFPLKVNINIESMCRKCIIKHNVSFSSFIARRIECQCLLLDLRLLDVLFTANIYEYVFKRTAFFIFHLLRI